MSLAHSPRIVTSGLVLAVDGANTRSYPGTGTTWSDLSGNNNTGTLVSSPTYNTSNGGTLVFNGSSQNINITDSTSLRVTDTFTISAWVYAVDLSGRYGIFSTRLDNPSGSWQLEIGTANGGTGRVAVTGVGTWIWESVDSVVTSTTWYHICFVKPNNATVGGSMYINGTLLIPLQTTAYTIINNSDIKTIGNGTSNGQFFPGGIANVTLYNRALTAGEVQQNYNALQARYLRNITPPFVGAQFSSADGILESTITVPAGSTVSTTLYLWIVFENSSFGRPAISGFSILTSGNGFQSGSNIDGPPSTWILYKGTTALSSVTIPNAALFGGFAATILGFNSVTSESTLVLGNNSAVALSIPVTKTSSQISAVLSCYNMGVDIIGSVTQTGFTTTGTYLQANGAPAGRGCAYGLDTSTASSGTYTISPPPAAGYYSVRINIS